MKRDVHASLSQEDCTAPAYIFSELFVEHPITVDSFRHKFGSFFHDKGKKLSQRFGSGSFVFVISMLGTQCSILSTTMLCGSLNLHAKKFYRRNQILRASVQFLHVLLRWLAKRMSQFGSIGTGALYCLNVLCTFGIKTHPEIGAFVFYADVSNQSFQPPRDPNCSRELDECEGRQATRGYADAG